MEMLTEKEAIIIQHCIEFAIKAAQEGFARFGKDTSIKDLENLLKKLRGEK